MNRDNDKGRVLLHRALVMFAAMMFLLSVIVIRLFYLQILQADKYKTMSDDNRIASRILLPQRGIIYDRNGVELAANRQNFRAAIVAEQSPKISDTLNKIAKIIPMEEGDIKAVENNIFRNRRFVPVKIKENLDWETVAALQLHASELPGIVIDEGFVRSYPFGDKFSHLLGYLGSVSEKEKDKGDPLLMVPDFKIGKTGVEKIMEQKLRGKSGSSRLEVNAFGRVMKHIDKQDPAPGENVYLSVDSRLQKKAYELLGDESGAVVVMNVKTGEILAYVSAPSFDANLFTSGMNQKTWNELVSNPKNPMADKIIGGVYSPGSTFKMITAIAGLRTGQIAMNTKINCSGRFDLGNHAFHCWKHSGHGLLNVTEALERSCDIFFYELALKVGIDEIAKVAHEFGLGELSGLGFNIERQGIIPDKKWKMRAKGEPWHQGESVIAAIGQGYVAVTPMQLAIMTARIANGKEKVMPTFLKQSKKTKFEPLKESKAVMEIVRYGMYEVVNGENGTAKTAYFNINGAKIAGKTGTTQVRRISMKERQSGIIKDEKLPWKLRNHALFVGYAPYNDPLYAVAVVVEHGSSGSGVAAPIASKVLQEAILLNSAE